MLSKICNINEYHALSEFVRILTCLPKFMTEPAMTRRQADAPSSLHKRLADHFRLRLPHPSDELVFQACVKFGTHTCSGYALSNSIHVTHSLAPLHEKRTMTSSPICWVHHNHHHFLVFLEEPITWSASTGKAAMQTQTFIQPLPLPFPNDRNVLDSNPGPDCLVEKATCPLLMTRNCQPQKCETINSKCVTTDHLDL